MYAFAMLEHDKTVNGNLFNYIKLFLFKHLFSFK